MGPKPGEPSKSEINQKSKYDKWMLALPHFKPYLEYKISSTKTLNGLYKIVMSEIGETGTLKTFSKSFERDPSAWATVYNNNKSDSNSDN